MKKLVLATAIAAATTMSMTAQAQEVGTFDIDVNVVASCQLVANPVNFGDVDAFADIDAITAAAPATLDVTCTNGAGYDIALGHTGQLTHATAPAVTYSLFQDAGFLTVWNDTTDTLAATGNGAIQNYDVFAQLAIDNTTEIGAYTGTVTVTVTF
ncbi:spore coat protein U domain-containing protein [Aliidiomarina soli]|uniref:Spore coat protein U/FanG domain-containing protein n=1 Tax=Aliidiomarina soli TaxID=1928574 RepID=A0A432WEE8_9GAMM|nr:spore coat protein U domain-containing protein [Aliidiomarina soli]RUO31200.1 hypothetical protein CWE14_11945 [Aliidiomarina soli]